jgi:hypothetical protein
MSGENDANAPEIDLDALLPEAGPEPVATPPAEPVTPVPDPEPTPAPQFAEEIEQLRAGYEEKLSAATQLIEQQSARMNSLEQLVNQGFQAAHAPPAEPEVPKFTKEELLADPLGTLEKVSEAKAKAAVKQTEGQITQVMGTLIERSHQAELKALEHKKYFKQLKPQIDEVFKANPQLKMQPNSAELAYNMLVGQNIETLETGATPAPAPAVPRTPVPTPAPGTPAAPAAPAEAPPKEEPKLTEAQVRLQKKFAMIADAPGLDPSDFEGV